MTDESSAIPQTPKEILTIAHLQEIEERRQAQRILAFCQVLDLEDELVGVSFDLTLQGICVSLPNTWPQTEPFQIKLKRMDNPELPVITVKVQPLWRQSRNENFDEIGGKIIEVNSPESFNTFLSYCQQAGPSGLVDRTDP